MTNIMGVGNDDKSKKDKLSIACLFIIQFFIVDIGSYKFK